MQNPIIGSLLKELDIGEKRYPWHLIKKAPNLVDIEIQSRLDALKNNGNNFNSNFRPPPPLPPSQVPPKSPPLPPPPTDRPILTPTAPPLSLPQNIFQPVTPSAPPLSRPPPYFFPRRTTNANTTQATRFSEATLEKNEQELVREIDKVLEDAPLPPTLEIADKILNILDDAEHVLQSDYVSGRVLNEKKVEDIKEEKMNSMRDMHRPLSNLLMVVKINIFISYAIY